MIISIYKNIFETKQGYEIEVLKALIRIKNGSSKELIDKIRHEQDKEKRDKLKQKLPCVLFGGTFEKREKKGLIKSSGFAVLDFDHVDLSLKDEFKKSKYTFACWVSPSGDGIKLLVKIPEVKNDNEYKEYYNCLLAEFPNANVDKSTIDISRVCYESYDPDIYVNSLSDIFDKKIVEQKRQPQQRNAIISQPSDNETYSKLLVWINKTESYINGNRNNYLNKLAYACNAYGLNKNTIEGIFKRDYDLPDKEISSIVNSAYKDTSIFNTAAFETNEKIREVKKMLREKTPIEEIKQIAPEELINAAKESLNRNISTFWTVLESGKKIKIVFHLEKFINWLEGNCFFKHIVNDGEFILIRIMDNVVEKVYRHDIRRFTYDYINALPFEFDNIYRIDLQEWFFNQEKKIISENVFELLTTKQIDFHLDEEKKATLFYRNTLVKVTDDDEIELMNYSKFDGYIWKDQIIQRDYEAHKAEGMFVEFLRDVFGDDEYNMDSISSCLGYLIHNYKPTAFSPAIVLNDKIISDDPNGGTGKGIIGKAISQFKNAVTLDGKTFDFGKSFAFQRIELSTDLLIFDDIKSNFNFETLFSIITEGITVEKKNKGEFFIPFERSPKILITTNYAIKGEGNSIERRKVDFELEQYYSKENTPFDKFGKMFFRQWDKNEWLEFDNYMIYCLQLYLSKGIILPKNINLATKRLIANTNQDFIDYMRDYKDFGLRRQKKNFHDCFVSETNLRQVKSNTLTKWVKKWCSFNEYKYEETIYQNARCFTIYNENKN